MLEVRYNKDTKEITGWCGDPNQFGNLGRYPNEVVVVLDIPIPDKPMDYWLYDDQKLKQNPDYKEKPEPRNPLEEIDKLTSRIESLEKKIGEA